MKRFFESAQIMAWICSTSFARLVGLATVLAVMATSFAVAAPRGKLIKPGRLMIDGLLVNCGRTPVLISEQSSDYGAAWRGLIILNPLKLRRLPRDAKLLVYYHECAHQYIGGSELAADCWAVQKVRREGLMDRAGLKNACSFIKNLPANRRHPSGIMRCRQMTRCFNKTFSQKAGKQPAFRPRGRLSNRGFSRTVSVK
ncbi:MAG: hypothetical protein GY927_06035 [bacterium]|nr:hypothetical protein [bacterium]